MTRMMSLVAAIAAVICFVSPAIAQSDAELKKIWGGGQQGASAYTDYYVPSIIDALDSQALSGYSWAGVSDGTVNNALQVTMYPTHLAVGQWDILKDLNGKPIPGAAPYPDGTVPTYNFTVLAQNIGPECLYMVTDQPGYSTFGHVLGNAWQMTIATGGESSGSYGTLKRLQNIYPELKDVVVESVGSALDIVNEVAGDSSVTHGFFVMRPDPQSSTFKTIKDEGLTLIPIVDFGLEGEYEFMELKVANGFLFDGPTFHTTACTSVALITGDPNTPGIPNRQLQRLKATIERIDPIPDEKLRPNISSWADMWDSLKSVATDKAAQMMEASKKALDETLKKVS